MSTLNILAHFNCKKQEEIQTCSAVSYRLLLFVKFQWVKVLCSGFLHRILLFVRTLLHRRILLHWGCRNLLLIGLEPEDVLEMLQLSLPFETDTVLTYQTFEPIVGIVVVEGTDILARTFVEPVLQFDIVEEYIIIIGCILHFCTGSHADKVKINSTKSMIGHLLGAAGGVEFITCVKSIEDGYVHPTVGLETPGEGCDLDYTMHEGVSMDVNYAISNSLGFGGHNASLIVKKITA